MNTLPRDMMREIFNKLQYAPDYGNTLQVSRQLHASALDDAIARQHFWRKVRHPNGYHYEDNLGRKQGPYKTFYSNGQPMVEITYHNGQLDGLYLSWYE